jgi:hypothetical protein
VRKGLWAHDQDRHLRLRTVPATGKPPQFWPVFVTFAGAVPILTVLRGLRSTQRSAYGVVFANSTRAFYNLDTSLPEKIGAVGKEFNLQKVERLRGKKVV